MPTNRNPYTAQLVHSSFVKLVPLDKAARAATAARLGLAGAQPGKSVGAPFLAANAMMDSEKAVGIVFLLHGGQPGIV